MSDAPAPLTLQCRVVPGDPVRTGAMGAYRRLEHDTGEPHVVRDELLADADERWRAGDRRPLLALAHVTDLQLADVQSPARFEFFNREFADPRFSLLVPTQRPNEAFTAHAVDATVRTLNRITEAPLTGAPLDLAVTTGDSIDNGQWNELMAVLALFEGGRVALAPSASGPAPRYEGVQRTDWPDEVFWRPDGEGEGSDLFRAGFGYPHVPGALERAMAAFTTPGLALPWLACYGNHEALIQGVGRMTPELAEALVGDRKPLALPEDLDRETAYETFVTGAHAFLNGPQRRITPDPSRRPVSRREFVEAHFRASARPHGHGFGERNRRDGTAYYCYDRPARDGRSVRFVALDTTCLLGGADGALDAEQLLWLESTLREVHSVYLSPTGEQVRTGNDDQLVILFSHHGLDTLTNRRGSGTLGAVGPDGAVVPVVAAAEVEALVHRFPNVVLWINGHTHTNGVRPRVSPHPAANGGRRGFWEVTTCAVVDWPCQTRIIELVDDARGGLAVVCTMVDHDSPLTPGSAMTGPELAALHRELAANTPLPGYGAKLAGTSRDRNVVLHLTRPF